MRDGFFAIHQLTHGTREGLYACVKKTLAYMGIVPLEWTNKLIGLGYGGTNANMRSVGGGLQSHLRKIFHGLWSPGALPTGWSFLLKMP